ncbi:hypothetical protein [Streptomyces albicerus]|uniref:hypothetical protein n=1 Tax=Streptomyces albicerus TaxID=2569859 RepID=UPI00124B2333|nr:hypothetical protein [Streptomyces albicerus]
MGWFKDKLFGGRSDKPVRRRVVRSSGSGGSGGSGVCDSCNADLDRERAYFLPTRTVVLSERYWAHAFSANKAVWGLFMDGDQLLVAFSDFVRSMAGQDSAWSICETCSEFFVFDRDTARSNAVNNRRPADSGAVDPAGCVLFAALGWERTYGSWPENVVRPDVADSCDFCQKTMYEGEFNAFVPQATLERYRADGHADHDPPARGPRTKDDDLGWIECSVCMARQLARFHQANYRPDPIG